MSVLFLGKRFYTNRDALRERFGRIYQLPRLWAEAGIPTRLWLIDYHTSRRERSHEGRLTVTSTPIRRPGWLVHWARIMASAFARGRPGVVLSSGDCYIGLLGYQLARTLRVRWIFDVYDKYDEFSGYRRLPGFDPFAFLLGRADRCLFASRALSETHGVRARGDFVVANGVDTERFRSLDRSSCRRAAGLSENGLFIGYFGGMEPDRGVSDLVDAVQELRNTGLGLELLLGGRRHPGLNLDRPGVRFLGNVPFERMPALLGSCDLLAVPYRRSAFMDAGASNKIAESLACGRPLVATRTPNLLANFPEEAQLLKDRLAGPGNSADIARVIRMQLQHPIVADLPEGMSWAAIARDAADRLGLSSRNAAPGGRTR